MKINEETGRPELSEHEQAERLEYIAGLRALANFYESRPDLRVGHVGDTIIYASDKDELAALIRAAGSLEKRNGYSSDTIKFSRHFGPIEFRIFADKKSTCERVKVGEEIVPAKPARTVELPAEPEKVVEKYEWRCPESFLAPAQPTTATEKV